MYCFDLCFDIYQFRVLRMLVHATYVSLALQWALCVNVSLLFMAYSSILNMSALSSSETFVSFP